MFLVLLLEYFKMNFTQFRGLLSSCDTELNTRAQQFTMHNAFEITLHLKSNKITTYTIRW